MSTAGLTWVLAQVDETLQEGFVEVVDKPSRAGLGKVEELTRGRLSRRRSEATRPYKSAERVELLLDALQRAAVETAELEDQVVGRLEGFAETREIEFAGEPDDLQPAFRVSTENRPQSDTALLRSALTELHRDIEQ